MKVLVTGGTGFVGPAIVRRLVEDGHTVRVLEHTPGASAALPSQEAVEGSMTDAASLRRAVEGQDAVVHLVALLTGSPEEFRRVMEEGTRELVAAAREAGVQRFVLMSALGTSEETKDLVPYYHAKWQMEQDVKASGLEHVIFRPSFVFGREGGALGQFKKIARLAPVTPIVGPGTQRLQPIWVEDVAAYFAAGLERADAVHLAELDRAQIVPSQAVPQEVVTMNSIVVLLDPLTRKEETYTLVFPEDADIGQGKISILAPIGTAMLGCEVGDSFESKVPAGKRRMKVNRIVYQPEAAGDHDP